MKIKTKLIISNILIIFIPLGIAVTLLGLFTVGPGEKYWEAVETITKDKYGVYSVEGLFYSSLDPEELGNTTKEMTRSGYHYSITMDGELRYSNITDADRQNAKAAVGVLWGSAAEYTVTRGDVTVVHEAFYEEGRHYDMLAVHTKEIPSTGGISYIKRYIALFICFMLCILLASVILLNLVLTWWVSRSILRPLRKLSVGSELIREGNLDFDMNYHKNNEIGQVISDFNEMRLHLKESVDTRLRYEQYRKELIIGISHDLRTPLTSIKGYVAGLRDGIASTEDMKIKYYEAIESSISSMENMADELTDFSRSDMNAGKYELSEIDLNDYYHDSVESLSRQYLGDDVHITLEKSDTPLKVKADEKSMERINTNIIENSIKYRNKTASDIRIALKRESDAAVISISDDGPGVKNKDLKRIFDCFYRADEARINPGKGSGIGLAVVKQIIEGHGGTVSAHNENGLTICMRIPLIGGTKNEENTYS